ncbi:hypothetical protein ACIBQ0_17000 [Nocardia nova]|uniref:hypothetical protein n=1 Tax=Nocardia nova TaxID=37330 RepID=UPI00379A6B08
MTEDEDRRLAETYANLFCIGAEVSAILDRYRTPRDLSAPEAWNEIRRKAIEDCHAGAVPIWRRNPDGTQVFFGMENDPEACRRRDVHDAAQAAAMRRSDAEMKRPNRNRGRG